MLGQKRPCARVVQRQLQFQADPIWITDDILSKALQSFNLGSQLSRRNGSSVPGPLESRKRVGRRRMTQLSQIAPAPSQVFGRSWGFRGAPNREHWQWEAPSSRSTPLISQPLSPPIPSPTLSLHLPNQWLSSLPDNQTLLLNLEVKLPVFADPVETFVNFLSRFQYEMKGASGSTAEELLGNFIRKTKSFIMTGTASTAELERGVQTFYKEVFRSSKSRPHADNQCLKLYWAIWEGLETRSKTNLEPIGVQALNIFGRKMAHLKDLSAAQDLALKIINTVPEDKTSDIEGYVAFLVQYWSKSFRKSNHPLEKLHYALVVQRSRRNPLIQAVLSVARFLDGLPLHLAHTIVRKTTETIGIGFMHAMRDTKHVLSPESSRRRYLWLLTVANTHCTNEALLVETWRTFNFLSDFAKDPSPYSSKMPRLTEEETYSILLEFSIKQNRIMGDRYMQINSFLHRQWKVCKQLDSGILLTTLAKNFSATAVGSFFRLLVQVGGPGTIRDTMQLLRQNGTLLREAKVVSMIRNISPIQPRDAFEIFKAHYYLSSGLGAPLRLEQFPNLVVALINNPNTNPDEIWGHLQKGLLPRLRRNPCRLPPSSKNLSLQKIALVYKMAEAFAVAQHLPEGVSFRNVVRCATYLRRYGVPLTSKLSMALTKAGVIRTFNERRRVGTTKSRWILGVIEKEEGAEVADVVDHVLARWRSASCRR